MGNMAYCRFQNTVDDLADCLNHINAPLANDEFHSRAELIEMCIEIARDYGDRQFTQKCPDCRESVTAGKCDDDEV